MCNCRNAVSGGKTEKGKVVVINGPIKINEKNV